MNKKTPYRVEILAIGSELLGPHRLDTNSLYLTERLNELGLEVCFKGIVGDDMEDLVLSFRQALERADLILAIGGLGPTADDLTREALARALNRRLILDENILHHIQARFARRRMAMPAPNIKQAYLIEGAVAIPNRNGTAPGQWLELDRKRIVLLPGPPHELKAMFEEGVKPKLESIGYGFLARSVLKTTGLTESQIESMMASLYPKSRDRKITLLAHPGQIEIHLTSFSSASRSDAEKKVAALKKRVAVRLRDAIFSETGEELEQVVARLLTEKKKTLAIAESSSGGLLGHRLTNIPGSSAYFLQGVVSYSNAAKTQLLGVSPLLIARHGAVSSAVCRAMARGIRKRAGADFGLAITGIAGPGGGSPEKPVGLVYVGLASCSGTKVRKNLFLGQREQIKWQSTQKALDMLRRHLSKMDPHPRKEARIIKSESERTMKLR